MRRFIIRLLLVALPFFVLVGTHYAMTECGLLQGNMVTTTMPCVTPSYGHLYADNLDYPEFAEMVDTIASDSVNDVLIMGDSFTLMGDWAFPHYLQHHLPDYKVNVIKTVLNTSMGEWNYILRSAFNPIRKNVFATPTDVAEYILLNYKRVPSNMIIESGEVHLSKRVSSIREDITDENTEEYTSQWYLAEPRIGQKPYEGKSFFKAFRVELQAMQMWIKKCVIGNQEVECLPLTKPMFSLPGNQRNLYILKEHVRIHSNEDIRNAVDKMHQLISLAKKRNCNLLFLVCPDKIDLYREFIKKDALKAYDESMLDRMEAMNIDNNVVNGKAILLPYLRNGEKDLYFCDDTHWTYKASDIVMQYMKKLITDE